MKIIRTTGIILLAAVIMAGCKKKEEHNLPTVNLNTEEMFDVTWELLRKYFKLEEVNIKKEFTDIYWK